MTTVFQPPPTWAPLIAVNELTKEPVFSPIWLQWFVDLSKNLSSLGAGSVTSITAGTGLDGGVITTTGSISVGTQDELNFNQTPFAVDSPGRLRWNPAAATLGLGMSFPGVVNPIGEALYLPPLYNNSGDWVTAGTVIGTTGYSSGGEGLTFVKYIADNSMHHIHTVAMVTATIGNLTRGLATRSGYVVNIDTTGTPYGEVWAVGDTLYASPVIAGGLTKDKPTVPYTTLPLGIVTVVHATEGVFLLLTPDTVEPIYYGVFSSSVDQFLAAANTVYGITYNSTDASNGITLSSPASRIVVDHPGFYNFQFSLQLESGTASSRLVSIWPRINGVDVPNSATHITIKNNLDVIVPAWNFVFAMGSGDYFELVWAADANDVFLQAYPVQAVPFIRPAIPSVILTVTQVTQ